MLAVSDAAIRISTLKHLFTTEARRHGERQNWGLLYRYFKEFYLKSSAARTRTTQSAFSVPPCLRGEKVLLDLVHRQLSPEVLPIWPNGACNNRRKCLLVLRILLG